MMEQNIHPHLLLHSYPTTLPPRTEIDARVGEPVSMKACRWKSGQEPHCQTVFKSHTQTRDTTLFPNSPLTMTGFKSIPFPLGTNIFMRCTRLKVIAFDYKAHSFPLPECSRLHMSLCFMHTYLYLPTVTPTLVRFCSLKCTYLSAVKL